MASKKKTDRLQRDKAIDALLDDDVCLNKLLERVEHQHENGGIFNDAAHHTVCMKALTEEDLE